MNAARLEESRGNLAEAKRRYAEVHQVEPSNAECAHRLGLICTQLNQHSEAEVYYRKALANDSNNPELLADMGYTAYLRQDFAQSESLLEQSFRLNPNNRRTYKNLAIVRAWLWKDEASYAIFRSLEGDVESLRSLAAIQVARGDQERGEKNFELARNINPGQQVIADSITAAPQIEVARTTFEPLELTLATTVAPPPPERLPTLKVASHGERYEPLELLHDDTIATSQIQVGSNLSSNNQETAARSLDFQVPIKTSLASKNPEQLSVWRRTILPTLQAELDAPTPLNVSNPIEQTSVTDRTPAAADVKDVCLVTVIDERRITKGFSEFSTEFLSQRYTFSSAESLRKFEATPLRYAPVAGGLDVVSVRNDKNVVQGSLNFAIWYRHRLYLFSSRENSEMFQQDPRVFVPNE